MKHDWIDLRQKYLLGEYGSLKDFAEKEGIDYSLLRKKAVGWVKEKQKRKEQNGNKTVAKIEEKRVCEAVENYCAINKKHYYLADSLIAKLKNIKPKTTLEIESMTRSLKNLQQVQRIARGMDKLENDTPSESVEFIIMDKGRNCKNNE